MHSNVLLWEQGIGDSNIRKRYQKYGIVKKEQRLYS
jgi:hypothetical protein